MYLVHDIIIFDPVLFNKYIYFLLLKDLFLNHLKTNAYAILKDPKKRKIKDRIV